MLQFKILLEENNNWLSDWLLTKLQKIHFLAKCWLFSSEQQAHAEHCFYVLELKFSWCLSFLHSFSICLWFLSLLLRFLFSLSVYLFFLGCQNNYSVLSLLGSILCLSKWVQHRLCMREKSEMCYKNTNSDCLLLYVQCQKQPISFRAKLQRYGFLCLHLFQFSPCKLACYNSWIFSY